MEKETPFVYSQKVIDLITVATEFCRRMEQCGEADRTDFVDAMRALLPMLYLKTTLLGPVPETAGYSAACVAEADYEYVRSQAAALMGEMDTYLDTFVDDSQITLSLNAHNNNFLILVVFSRNPTNFSRK